MAVAWDWSHALLGAAYAVPAAVLVLTEPGRGLALAAGVLPAATFGLAPHRGGRIAIVVLGALTGVSMFLGSVLATLPAVAVPALFVLCVVAAIAASGSKLGLIALSGCVPIVGIGLSYGGIRDGAAAGLLMFLGSVYAFVVSLAWPTKAAGPPRGRPAATRREMLGYGVRLGLATSLAAAIGFGLRLEHVGWACGAALLVMRPAPELVRMRGGDRVLAVLVGATAGAGLAVLDPANLVIAAAVLVALAALAGTHGSGRYVTPAFTTFVVFLLLLVGSPGDAGSRFLERMAETGLGVGLAGVFGVLIPALLARRGR